MTTAVVFVAVAILFGLASSHYPQSLSAHHNDRNYGMQQQYSVVQQNPDNLYSTVYQIGNQDINTQQQAPYLYVNTVPIKGSAFQTPNFLFPVPANNYKRSRGRLFNGRQDPINFNSFHITSGNQKVNFQQTPAQFIPRTPIDEMLIQNPVSLNYPDVVIGQPNIKQNFVNYNSNGIQNDYQDSNVQHISAQLIPDLLLAGELSGTRNFDSYSPIDKYIQLKNINSQQNLAFPSSFPGISLTGDNQERPFVIDFNDQRNPVQYNLISHQNGNQKVTTQQNTAFPFPVEARAQNPFLNRHVLGAGNNQQLLSGSEFNAQESPDNYQSYGNQNDNEEINVQLSPGFYGLGNNAESYFGSPITIKKNNLNDHSIGHLGGTQETNSLQNSGFFALSANHPERYFGNPIGLKYNDRSSIPYQRDNQEMILN